MYSLQDIEDIILLIIDDTKNYCDKRECISCQLAKVGACNGDKLNFIATRLGQQLANRGIIPFDKIFPILNVFMQGDINGFILEVYKVYQGKE